jgi:hypothetical protein
MARTPISTRQDVSDNRAARPPSTDQCAATGAIACLAGSTSGGRRRDSDAEQPPFRDGPKDQTSDVRLHIGESPDSRFALTRAPATSAARLHWE